MKEQTKTCAAMAALTLAILIVQTSPGMRVYEALAGGVAIQASSVKTSVPSVGPLSVTGARAVGVNGLGTLKGAMGLGVSSVLPGLANSPEVIGVQGRHFTGVELPPAASVEAIGETAASLKSFPASSKSDSVTEAAALQSGFRGTSKTIRAELKGFDAAKVGGEAAYDFGAKLGALMTGESRIGSGDVSVEANGRAFGQAAPSRGKSASGLHKPASEVSESYVGVGVSADDRVSRHTRPADKTEKESVALSVLSVLSDLTPFTREGHALSVALVLLPLLLAAGGIYAGLATGTLAGLAGLVAAAPVAATLASAFGRSLTGRNWGGLLGFATGALSGGALGWWMGSSTSSWIIAAALGIAGIGANVALYALSLLLEDAPRG